MKKILTIFLSISLIFSSNFILSSCERTTDSESAPDSAAEESREEINITVGTLRGPSAIGMIKLIDRAADSNETGNFSYEIVGSPDIMISRIMSNEISIAVLPTNVAAKLYNKGVNIKLVAVVGGGVLYIVSNKNQNIKKGSWKDLKGKTINIIAKGSTPDVIFRYLADKNGIDTRTDLTCDYSFDQVELSQLLIAEKQYLGILPEPFVTGALETNDNLEIILDIQEEWGKASSSNILPQTCLIVSSDIIDHNKNILETFLNDYKDSISWANNHPGDAGIIAEKLEIGIKEEIAETVIPRCNLVYRDKKSAREILDEYMEILYQFSPEDTGGKIPDSRFYYDG
jgi:NitT/TauT family transport system substrate-binding protein